MVIILLGVVGVVLFVIGVSFLLKGYFLVPSAGSTVPRTEFDALEKNLEALRESEEKIKGELALARGELEVARESFDLTNAEGQKNRALIEELQKKNEQQAAEIEHLKIENESQKEVDRLKIQHLEEEIVAIHAKTAEQAQGALQLIESLKEEIKSLKARQPQGAGAGSSGVEGSDPELQKIKELNAQLMERERMAQLDLAKSRAQAAGLGKICGDFKTKFENMEKIENELKEARAKIDLLEKEKVIAGKTERS